MSLRVRFLSAENAAALPTDHILAAIGFGGAALPDAPVAASVGMASLADTPLLEIWESSHEVIRHPGEIAMAADGEFLFGTLSAIEADGLAAVTERLYRTMLRQVEASPYKRLLRIWHYIPQITEQTDAGERYHLFNQGRQAALDDAPQYAVPPAASALGSATGKLTLVFVAARENGVPLENPRQMAAYHYPPQYGPRPRFSRAMLVSPLLFISGTASIVGHESRHLDDLAAQTVEMIENIRTMLTEGDKAGPCGRALTIKAYIRHPVDAAYVRTALSKAFPGASVACLQADVCRAELLVEAEATAFENCETSDS